MVGVAVNDQRISGDKNRIMALYLPKNQGHPPAVLLSKGPYHWPPDKHWMPRI